MTIAIFRQPSGSIVVDDSYGPEDLESVNEDAHRYGWSVVYFGAQLSVTPSQIQSLARIGYRVSGEDKGNVYLSGNGEGVMCPLSGLSDFISEMTPKN